MAVLKKSLLGNTTSTSTVTKSAKPASTLAASKLVPAVKFAASKPKFAASKPKFAPSKPKFAASKPKFAASKPKFAPRIVSAV
jgi:hypothetical protein